MDIDYYDPRTIIEDRTNLDGNEHDNRLKSIARVLANEIRDIQYAELDKEMTTAESDDPFEVFFHELKKRRDELQ